MRARTRASTPFGIVVFYVFSPLVALIAVLLE
jgi:hypothetical protein